MGGVASPLDKGVAAVPGSPVREPEDALTAMIDLVGADLVACNRTIVARMDSPVTLIPERRIHPHRDLAARRCRR